MADGLTVEIKGLNKALKNLKSYQVVKTTGSKIILKENAAKIELAAKEQVPVDTGNLKSSLTTEESNKGLIQQVGTNVKYAPFVEFGTRRMGARPYLYPAYFMYEGEIIKRISALLKKKIK